MNKSKFLLLVITLTLLVSPFILGLENETITEQDAINCINNSKQIMTELSSLKFNTIRVNDTIKQAQDALDLQLLQKERKKAFNFKEVIIICDEIKTLKEDAISSRDQFNALLSFYKDSSVAGMNTLEIDETIKQIESEINDERYENVPNLITKCYDQISSARAAASALKIFTASTTRNFKDYMYKRNLILPMENYKAYIIFIILLLILYLSYRTRISKILIQKKIDKLEIRKKTLKKLVMQVQSDYFHNGKISESEYSIKTSKFSELIRDIDRQIPLLKEELAKIESKMRFKKLNKE